MKKYRKILAFGIMITALVASLALLVGCSQPNTVQAVSFLRKDGLPSSGIAPALPIGRALCRATC